VSDAWWWHAVGHAGSALDATPDVAADDDAELRELEAAMRDDGAGSGAGSAGAGSDDALHDHPHPFPHHPHDQAHAHGAIATPDDEPTWAEFTASWDLFREAIYAGALSGAVLGFLSVFVVLRRMVFLSAAVTQAAGLGVALAFYAAIHLGLAVDPVLGATLLSLVTAAALSRDFQRWGLSREMVLGMAFALASGAAVLVGSRISQEAHDVQSILFGTAVVVGADDFHRLIVAAAIVMAIQLWWFRGFAFASFDPTAARVQRVPVGILDLVLLLSIAVMLAQAARALGAMPAFAMSTLPGMAAILLARGPLIVPFLLAAVFGAIAGVGGYLLAFFKEFPVGSSQTVVAVLLVAAAALARGLTSLVSRLRRG
jgi:zinc transport system permease protein